MLSVVYATAALLCLLATPAVSLIHNGRLLSMQLSAAPFGSESSFKRLLATTLPNAQQQKKKLSLLGSTGSIGTQTLDICRERPDMFECVALSAGDNIDLLIKQVLEFKPKVVSVREAGKADILRTNLLSAGLSSSNLPAILSGSQGICDVATFDAADTVVTGIVGCAGLLPTISAIKAGKNIALANKETLIAGGPVVVPLLKKHNVNMLPADSEHSAIFQCLQGLPPGGLKKVLLTASGGAFRDWPKERLSEVRVADALKHPNWAMGAKITVDSATMMNKGLEVIEAYYLFGVDYDNIDIVVHPQSIIHSAIETVDSSMIAQLGWPDMRLPLLYAISWPNRVAVPWPSLDLAKVGSLTFTKPDLEKYPCIRIAYEAGRQGGSMTACLNAANERANELFRKEKLSFLGIAEAVERTMSIHAKSWIQDPTLDDIINVDIWSRATVDEVVQTMSNVRV